MTTSPRTAFTILAAATLAAVFVFSSVLLSSDAATGDSGTSGLEAVANQLWQQDTPGVEGAVDGGEEFGSALVVADFDGDGFADLAVGVPKEDVAGHANAGAVNVFYGSEDGITADNDQYWTQESFLEGSSAAFDSFGQALGTGDFNNDGYSDLVIGIPGKAINDLDNAGMAYVVKGSPSGLTLDDGYFVAHQDNGLEGLASTGDKFGSAFAAGDFNGDGVDDLAIGVPGEEIIFGEDEVGGVNVIYGTEHGLTLDANQLWTQGSPDIEGAPEDGDEFGASLAAGDFDHDGKDDLAIGVPGESVGDTERAGATNIIYGGPTGLHAAGDQIIHQDITGVPGVPNEDDELGTAVASGDFNADGFGDVAIGIPGESPNDESASGTVLLVLGSETGLVVSEGVNYTKAPPPMVASDGGASGQFNITANDRFGAALAVGDFDGDGHDDLAAGAPGHDTGALDGAGAVHVYFGGDNGLTSEGREFFQAGVNGILGEAEAGASFGSALATGDFNGGNLDDLAIGAPNATIDELVNAGTVHVIYSDIDVATPTNTLVPATNTPTDTPVPPTDTPTNTPGPETPTATPTNTLPPGGIVGDVDCSGAVNAIDAAYILQYVAGLVDTLPCLGNADANEDGQINTVDAALILQYSAGLIGTLPP